MSIKQLEERNVANEITLMVWGDRMDLVALANVKGEVALHRLKWTQAWSLNPPKEGTTVAGMAWRPDGKIIAIAYSLGQVILVTVENKHILHTIKITNEISCISWCHEKSILDRFLASNFEQISKPNQYMKHVDKSTTMLPEPESQNYDCSESPTSEAQMNNILQFQTSLNLLLIGTTDGQVHIHVFGCFPCAVLDLAGLLSWPSCSIQSVHLSETLNKIFVTVKNDDNEVKLALFDAHIFTTHANELFAVAHKHIKLMFLVNYLKSTISAMRESYENILLEMDLKLAKYAEKVAEGGVTADFLELLMFGISSDEMKEFLLHDLTRKGLEKFGQNIELSYSNIKKLLLKHVMKFGQNITFHLSELRGMARLEHRYESLGIVEETISQAILQNGAFLIKCAEMQQVMIDHANNFQAFFRWLYIAIIHVMEIPVPNDITKLTQQDHAGITEFLQNFDKIGNNSAQNQFVMERLGQYLNNRDLVILSHVDGNDWAGFLAQNHCLSKHDSILQHFPHTSLVQQYKLLRAAVEAVFAAPQSSINRQFRLLHVLELCQVAQPPKISHINLSTDQILLAFLENFQNVYLLHIDSGDSSIDKLNCVKIYFSREKFNENYNILDIKLYSSAVLSVLLQENSASKQSVLCQLPLQPVVDAFSDLTRNFHEGKLFKNYNVNSVNGSNLVPIVFKSIERMNTSQFAVSGTRKVGIVLSESRRKVRLYEMEGEEEDDEDADMTSMSISTRDGDLSFQDTSLASLGSS